MNTVIVPQINTILVMPQIIMGILGLVVLLAGAFLHKSRQEWLALLTLLGLNITVFYLFSAKELGACTLNNMIVRDGFALLFNLFFLISTAFVVTLSIPFVEKEKIPAGEYYSLLIFATLGMMIMASSTELLIIFLGLELMSISLYILAGITKDKEKSAEAGLKYLLMGAFSSAFLLYGIAFIYGATGSTNLMNILAWVQQRPPSPHEWMLPAGVGLIMIGLGFKVGLVPFHMWIPDVYEGSPTIITAFMAIGPKAAAFAALCRFLLVGPFNEMSTLVNIPWPILLAGLAGLTMTIGNVVAIAQNNIKRMLAYSSIAHAGYVLVGLDASHASASGPILFYLIAYFLMNLGAFAIVYLLQGNDEKGLAIREYSGLGYRKPLLAFALSVFLLSLAGFPVTAGFMGKFQIFREAVDAGRVGLVLIALLNSVISVYYYLRVVVFMYMHDQDEPSEQPDSPIPAVTSFIIILCLIGVFYLGLFPATVLKLINSLIIL